MSERRMSTKMDHAYTSVPSEDIQHNENVRLQTPRARWRYLPWLLHFILISISMTFFILGQSVHTNHDRMQDDTLNWETILNPPTPSKFIRFNGTFDRSSPFKGPPSPEVDEAWDSILPLKFISVPENVFKRLNASKHAVKVPPRIGTGRLAIFEAVHQIHCVRSLWKATNLDYYTDYAEYARKDPDDYRAHLDHCADILRQKLMCDADSSLITYNWLKNHWSPHPNFNVQHKCHDYGRIIAAVEKYSLDDGLVPEGGFVRPDLDKNGDGKEWGDVVDFVEPPFDPEADA